jgi:histidinol-phosphate/aromatic aminotransferase/cobyric acid decarboxylase-like protein
MEKFVIRTATPQDRDGIYRLRHDVYATELAQHCQNPESALRDSLDEFNEYIVAVCGDGIAGFISITPPGHDKYSVDKYLDRDELPFACDTDLYEVRLLTVLRPFRTTFLSELLMYAAYRWVQSRGGKNVIAIGRKEVLSMYEKVGFQTSGRRIQSGAVTYELIHAPISHLRKHVTFRGDHLQRIGKRIDWRIDIPFLESEQCEHGGRFFDALGDEFDSLQKREAIINADVLDAWFPPAPEVLDCLRENLEWILRTSPPTGCEGMVRAISKARGVPVETIVPGAGSSDLMFLTLPKLLPAKPRALLLNPTYGEYAHLLGRLCNCKLDRFLLRREENYRIDAGRLMRRIEDRYDLVVLVHPNNPTGSRLERRELESLLDRAPKSTVFWIDETYVDYVGPDESVERFAARSKNVVVCKSMSKAYALSGARAAYLVAPNPIVRKILRLTPPWAVGLAAQIAAVKAVQHPDYYQQKYEETRRLRSELIAGLRNLGTFAVHEGAANFVLCRLPEVGPDAAALVERCRNRGLFLRDISSMTIEPETHSFRIAVKDAATNEKMLSILGQPPT